jgi:hypothetical protein
MVVGVGLLVAVDPATAATAPSASTLVLTASQVPGGWQAAKVPAVNSDVPFVPLCTGGAYPSDGRSSQALVTYRQPGGYPSVVELVATYSSARAAFKEAGSDLAKCLRVAGPRQSSTLKATVGRLYVRSFGNQSLAYTLSFAAVKDVGIDNVVVRQGRDIFSISLSAKGVPSTAQLDQFVTLALGSVIQVHPD